MNRQERYGCFGRFAESAGFMFGKLRDRSDLATEYTKYYSFYAVAGGTIGGVDKSLVEVLFGQRAIDQVELFDLGKTGLPQRKTTVLSERGARLMYERTDSGRVVCTLFPAGTKDLQAREDFLVLGWLNETGSINSPEIHHKYWRSFLSYMACTSLDGVPTAQDRLRVAYLRLAKIRSIDGRIQPRMLSIFAGRVVTFSLTVGLSGFLLVLINIFSTSEDSDRTRLEREQIIRELAEVRALTISQASQIRALQERATTAGHSK